MFLMRYNILLQFLVFMFTLLRIVLQYGVTDT